MEVLETQENDIWVVSPRGRIDSNNCKAFEQQLMERITTGATRVVVDLADLDYISSAGLRVLLMGAKRQKAVGARFALCSLKEHIREVFEVGGFTQILEIHVDRSTALQALA